MDNFTLIFRKHFTRNLVLTLCSTAAVDVFVVSCTCMLQQKETIASEWLLAYQLTRVFG